MINMVLKIMTGSKAVLNMGIISRGFRWSTKILRMAAIGVAT